MGVWLGNQTLAGFKFSRAPRAVIWPGGLIGRKTQWKMESKRLQRARKAAGSATLATKGLGPRPSAVQVPIKTDQDRTKAGGLQGAAWRTKATQLQAALRLRGLIKPH